MRHATGTRRGLFFTVGVLISTLGVTGYGAFDERPWLGLIALTASVLIGVAIALRARESIRTMRNAYARLDRALATTEREKDELMLANEELGRANVELRALHVAFADLLNLADERTNGRLRALIEDTGGEIVQLIEDEIAPERTRRR